MQTNFVSDEFLVNFNQGEIIYRHDFLLVVNSASIGTDRAFLGNFDDWNKVSIRVLTHARQSDHLFLD